MDMEDAADFEAILEERIQAILEQFGSKILNAYQTISEEKSWSYDARAAMVAMVALTDPKRTDAGLGQSLVAASVQIADGLAEARRVRQGKAAASKVDELAGWVVANAGSFERRCPICQASQGYQCGQRDGSFRADDMVHKGR